MMNSFILAGALTFGNPVVEVYPDKDATRYIAKALYKEINGDIFVSRLEKRYLNLDEYPGLKYTGIVVRVATEKRITYRWTF